MFSANHTSVQPLSPFRGITKWCAQKFDFAIRLIIGTNELPYMISHLMIRHVNQWKAKGKDRIQWWQHNMLHYSVFSSPKWNPLPLKVLHNISQKKNSRNWLKIESWNPWFSLKDGVKIYFAKIFTWKDTLLNKEFPSRKWHAIPFNQNIIVQALQNCFDSIRR